MGLSPACWPRLSARLFCSPPAATIEANKEELNRLQELFEELATMDEAEAFHFTRHPYGTAPIERISAGYDGFIEDIYRLLYQLGTPDTRAHISTMGLFPEGSLT